MRTALPDLSIRQLEYLVAVVDESTWARAADRVGVSASALSQGLAELERRIGLPLFDRAGRRRVLRPGAKPLLDHARQVVALTSDVASWAERARTGRIGALRVGMIDAAAVGHYPEVLSAFRDDHPELDMRLRVAPSGRLLDELAASELDVVVCVPPPEGRSGVDLETLRHEDLAVHTFASRPGKDPSAWGPWVLFSEGSHTRGVIDAALRDLGTGGRVVAESNQPEVLRTMVALGVGWTVLPPVQAGKLRRGPVVAERRLALGTRRSAALDPAVEMFVAALRGSTS